MTTPQTCSRPVLVLTIASCAQGKYETERVSLLPAVLSRLCPAVVVSLNILPYVEWLDAFCLGVQMPLLTFLVRCRDLERKMRRFMADGKSLSRVITNGLLHCGQTHSNPTRGSRRG